MMELVIVITIIGVMSTIAIPKFADAGSGRRLSSARKVLVSDIESTKIRARATAKIHIIKFYKDENRYIIFEGKELSRSAIVLVRDFDEDPYSVGIRDTSLGADSYAVITVYGDVSPGFTVGIIDNKTEIQAVIAGIADVGLSATDSISDDDVKAASVGDSLLSKDGG